MPTVETSIPGPHRLTERDLVALATGASTSRITHTLTAARRSRTMLLVHFAVQATADPRLRAVYRTLQHVQRLAPAAVATVLDHPTVGAWATRTAARVNQGGRADPAELARVVLAAAVRGRVTVSVPTPSGEEVFLPSLGVAVLRDTAAETRLHCGPDGADLGPGTHIPRDWWKEGPDWSPTPRIDVDCDGLQASFLLDRWGPEALPEDLDVAEDPDVAQWRERIAAGWEVLVRHHRGVADELATIVTTLTPLRDHGDGPRSATADDAFGCLFLSLPPDAVSAAVTLAHELQHTKLVALMDLFPMVDPVDEKQFYAPWREDPRPAMGLLHGIFAFSGVTAFWRGQRRLEPVTERELLANVEFARWRAGAHHAARALLHSQALTDIGRTFVAAVADLLERWHAEPVPENARAIADRLAEEHLARWQDTNRQVVARPSSGRA
jgi:HEXXH motif-containing protein